ncbi:MAG: hypothetical protein QOF11_1032 [Chloroflexota bacterium]|nr:hypothetical protein [Chloroflexota bacterium]
MRRHALVAFASVLLAGGAVAAWPPLTQRAPTTLPVGAVLPETAMARPAAVAAAVPVVSPGPTAAPAPLPLPAPQPAIHRDPWVIRALAAEGPWAPDPGRLSGYRWPLANGVITSPFGPSPYGALIVNGERFHDGLDVASFCGDVVVAAHDGWVLAAGRRFDPWIGWVGSLEPHIRRMNQGGLWGELPITVIVDDGDGYRAIYAHFNAVTVKAGQYVRAGQQIGWEGSTGFATGCHVHFGLFSPLDTRRLELRPDVHRRTKYPRYEVARIDPLLVLPALTPGRTTGPFPTPSLTP